MGEISVKIVGGKTVTALVSVKRDKESRTYRVEYDVEGNVLRSIALISEGRRVEVGAKVLEEMIEIVKAMGLKFPQE
jgi:hypothetical protein